MGRFEFSPLGTRKSAGTYAYPYDPDFDQDVVQRFFTAGFTDNF